MKINRISIVSRYLHEHATRPSWTVRSLRVAGEEDTPGNMPRRQAALWLATQCVVGWNAKIPSAQALPLAPLGKMDVSDEKFKGLSADQLAQILAKDIGERQYFVTGELTPEIFDDACRFIDPTNETKGLSRYRKALTLLFDPAYSITKLKDIRVTGPRTIEATWILGGYLKFPWNPRVEPFEGRTLYRLNDKGLIVEQRQTWSKSGIEALRETFTPTSGVRSDIKNMD